MPDCSLPSFGLDVVATSSASVLVSLRPVNGTRPGQCPALSSRRYEVLVHRRVEGRWQGLVSGPLPRELPGVRCGDEHGCVFRACSSIVGLTPKGVLGAADPHCTQPSLVLQTPRPVLPSPEPHLAARLELVVSPPLSPPNATVARAWVRELSDELSLPDFSLLPVEISSTGALALNEDSFEYHRHGETGKPARLPSSRAEAIKHSRDTNAHRRRYSPS